MDGAPMRITPYDGGKPVMVRIAEFLFGPLEKRDRLVTELQRRDLAHAQALRDLNRAHKRQLNRNARLRLENRALDAYRASAERVMAENNRHIGSLMDKLRLAELRADEKYVSAA